MLSNQSIISRFQVLCYSSNSFNQQLDNVKGDFKTSFHSLLKYPDLPLKEHYVRLFKSLMSFFQV